MNHTDPMGTDWQWNFSGVTKAGGQWDYVPGTNPNVPYPDFTPAEAGGVDYIDAAAYRGIKSDLGVPVYALGPFEAPYSHLPAGVLAGHGSIMSATEIGYGEAPASPSIENGWDSTLAYLQQTDEAQVSQEEEANEAYQRAFAAQERENTLTALPFRVLAEPVADIHDIGALAVDSNASTWSLQADTARSQLDAGHSVAYSASVGAAWALGELATLKAGTVVRGISRGFGVIGLDSVATGAESGNLQRLYQRVAASRTFGVKLAIHNSLSKIGSLGNSQWISRAQILAELSGNSEFRLVPNIFRSNINLVEGRYIIGGTEGTGYFSRRVAEHELLHLGQFLRNPNILTSGLRGGFNEIIPSFLGTPELYVPASAGVLGAAAIPYYLSR